MKPNFSKLALATLLTASFIFGCNLNEVPNFDNTYLPNYEGEIALIVGKDTLTVGDFIKELSEDSSVVKEGDDLGLFIVYEDSSDFSIGTDFIDVNTFSNEKSIESPVAFAFASPFDTTLVIDREINFNYVSNEGEQLDSMFYNSGTLQLEVTSDFPGDVTYTITTNSFINDQTNEIINISSGLNYTGFRPISNTSNTPLAGYKTILEFQNDSSVFTVNVMASIDIQGGTPLTGNESINVKVDVVDPTFNSIYGSFGKDTFDIESQEINLDIFSEFSESGISFEAPTIYFTLENSFGVSAGLDFSEIFATYPNKPDLALTGSFADNLQLIAAPSLENVGQKVSTTLELNNNNSNIGEILSSSPNKLMLSMTGISNPDNETSNFILDNSLINFKTRVELPLSLRLEAFEYDSEFELGDLSQLEQSESLTLIIQTLNELPIGGEIDIHFLNEDGEAIDSLKNITILESPVAFDSNGKTSEASSLEARISLDADKIESLTKSTSLRVNVRFNSFGFQQDEFVQIFSDYSLITTIAIEGKVSINLNE